MMERYKSWQGLAKQLHDRLCPELRGKVTYFLTRYHDVHNAYGRAAIRVDGKEWACFSWIEQFRHEWDFTEAMREQPESDAVKLRESLKPKWDENCEYCEMDFLDAALRFRSMSVRDALRSENLIIRILAVLDRRVGSRTLAQIAILGEFEKYPEWVRRFYTLRLTATRKQARISQKIPEFVKKEE